MTKSDRLSDFELLVMLAIAAIGDDAYSVGIANHIEQRAGRDVSIGALVALTPAERRTLQPTMHAPSRMLDGVTLKPAIGSRR
jgi:hypothetical protein